MTDLESKLRALHGDIVVKGARAGYFDVNDELLDALRTAADLALEAAVDFMEHDYKRNFNVPWRDDLASAIRALRTRGGSGVGGE